MNSEVPRITVYIGSLTNISNLFNKIQKESALHLFSRYKVGDPKSGYILPQPYI